MSRSKHEKSEYKLRKLPECSKCRTEFILATFSYVGRKSLSYEWECPQCHKTVPKELLREETPDREDQWLHEWCIRESRQSK